MDLLLLNRRQMLMQGGVEIKPIQIVQNGDFADGANNWSAGNRCSISVADGVLTITKTNVAGHIVAVQAIVAPMNHYYFYHADMKITTATTGSIYPGYLDTPNTYFTPTVNREDASDWMTVTRRVSSGASNKTGVRPGGYVPSGNTTFAVGDKIELKNIYLIDLTATFGAGNEPDLATCQALFPEDYYEYYTGE